MADLASTVSYLKSLNDTLKATTDALNGDNPTTKTAYYKADTGRTLYWDGFMPKIVTTLLEGETNYREYNPKPLTGSFIFVPNRNKRIIAQWLRNNPDKLALVAEQLTRKLGKDKFKNMTLTNPVISMDELIRSEGRYYTPKVTFNLTPKDGYTLADNSENTVTLTIRNLYKEANPDTNVFATQGTSFSAVPSGSSVDDANVKAKVNVYLNYTGPSIVLDQDLPTVGTANNTSINGTSNVTGDFNTKFKNLLINVVGESITQTSLLQAIINYVNKFDPKFPASFVLNTNGVALTSVQSGTQLRIGSLNDFLYNNKGFLQQVHGDSTAVYFAVNGVTSQGWLNTFLIRIPLTKFVKPVTVFTPPVVTPPKQDDSQEDSSNAGNTNENTETPVEDQTGQESSESGSAQTDQAQQESPQT
ncbi:hemagglutinin [Mycoplasmopsis synoviae]|uniref:hemagglutinin n=1 Tax=Mycoplasmopsis synoviae TaxID=2109 RepID=UPI001CE1F6E8|nr:hemagglutinin [Mycoplasmopsis synoviae]